MPCARCRRRRRQIERREARRRGRYRGDISRFSEDDPSDDDDEEEDDWVAELAEGDRRRPGRPGLPASAYPKGSLTQRRALGIGHPLQGVSPSAFPKGSFARRRAIERALGLGRASKGPAPIAPAKPQWSRSQGAGQQPHGLGTAHPRDPAKAHFRYALQTSRGQIFGSDVARFSEGSSFGDDDPVSRSLEAISRFRRRR
jgi:hypothetical protein